MTDLSSKKCLPCEGGEPPLASEEIHRLLTQTPSWELNSDSTAIYRRFTFKNFYMTMGFVNAIAWLANQENHHPDLSVGYNYCEVKYTTHAIKGLSENDFISAAKINNMMK